MGKHIQQQDRRERSIGCLVTDLSNSIWNLRMESWNVSFLRSMLLSYCYLVTQVCFLLSIIPILNCIDLWSLHDIARKLKAEISVIKPALQYWTSVGALEKLDNNQYRSNTHLPASAKTGRLDPMIINPFSIKKSKLDEMRIYFGYINNKLTNAGGPLSVEAIHRHLVLFIQGLNKFTRTVEELREFLNVLVEEGKLDMEGLLYKRKLSHT